MRKKAYFNEESFFIKIRQSKTVTPEFVSWLIKGKENIQVKCQLCHKVIELSNMGIQALKISPESKEAYFSCEQYVFFSNLVLPKTLQVWF